MDILTGLQQLRQIPPHAVLSVGNYDGLHLGHQRLLTLGRELTQGKAPLVVLTFEPHPLQRLKPQAAPPRLTPPALKRQRLADAGVDVLVELTPDHEVLSITAQAFFELLAVTLKVSHLVEGPDFNFGKGREGNIASLRRWSENSPMEVHVVSELERPLTNLQIVPVRSSVIRWLIAYGRVRDAAICLGRPYTLEGTIVEGFRRGRELGVPTANFDCGEQFIPADGVYAGRCEVDGRCWPAGISIGTLPTFNENKRQVEAHLLGFEGNLYGRVLRLELLDYLREQVRFANVEDLKSKMRRDMQQAAERMGINPAQPLAAL